MISPSVDDGLIYTKCTYIHTKVCEQRRLLTTDNHFYCVMKSKKMIFNLIGLWCKESKFLTVQVQRKEIPLTVRLLPRTIPQTKTYLRDVTYVINLKTCGDLFLVVSSSNELATCTTFCSFDGCQGVSQSDGVTRSSLAASFLSRS